MGTMADLDRKAQARENAKKNRDFFQVSRAFALNLAELASESKTAFKIFMFLAKHMDGANALCVSMLALEDALGISRSTANRAIKHLKNNGWICVLKTGTSNIYVLNPKVVWSSYANQKKYCQFKTNVIISPTENEDYIDDAPRQMTQKVKHVNDKMLHAIAESELVKKLELDRQFTDTEAPAEDVPDPTAN